MDPAPMNKTEIISFIIDEIVLKLWNINSNMRKRVQMVLKDKDITVKEYSDKALKLNGWIKVNNISINNPDPSEIRKGVSNCLLQTEEAAEKIISLNKTLRCGGLCFESYKSFEIDKIVSLCLISENFEFYCKHSFNRINKARFVGLSNDQINQILSKIKQIDKLTITNSAISKLDLTQFKIKELSFDYVKFTEKVWLPTNLNYLYMASVEGLKCINTVTATKVDFFLDCEEDTDLRKIRGIKIFRCYFGIASVLEYLPSTLRSLPQLSSGNYKELDSHKIKRKFPYLINIEGVVLFEFLENLNSKQLSPKQVEAEEKAILRFRQILVHEKNVNTFNKHPELLEKVRKVEIASAKFNFDCLPGRIKRLVISCKVDLKTKSLIRFEKECLEV